MYIHFFFKFHNYVYTGSYGSLARFRSISRLYKINDSTVAAGSGDYADFQYIEKLFEYMK